MQSTHFGALKAQDQFRAIEGVILFFDSNGLGAPESWVSYVDAGIVEGIERGGAIALGLSTDDGGNKGSAIWASFFRRKRDGQLDDRTVSLPSGPRFLFVVKIGLLACLLKRTRKKETAAG